MSQILNLGRWILAILLVFPISLIAKEKAPKPFQDSQITRTLEDGKKQNFDGNKYKIVPRNGGSNASMPKVIKVTKKVYYRVPERRKNISVHAGYAPVGLERDGKNAVNLEREIVLGLSYSQKFGRNMRFQVMGLTNKSIIGGLGLDF